MPRATTEQQLSKARAAIVRWERRLRRAGNALQKYRRTEARLIRKASAEVAEASKPQKPAGPVQSRKSRKITLQD